MLATKLEVTGLVVLAVVVDGHGIVGKGAEAISKRLVHRSWMQLRLSRDETSFEWQAQFDICSI